MKRLVARVSLHILSSLNMFKWTSENIPGVIFLYITCNDVSHNATIYDLGLPLPY